MMDAIYIGSTTFVGGSLVVEGTTESDDNAVFFVMLCDISAVYVGGLGGRWVRVCWSNESLWLAFSDAGAAVTFASELTAHVREVRHGR